MAKKTYLCDSGLLHDRHFVIDGIAEVFNLLEVDHQRGVVVVEDLREAAKSVTSRLELKYNQL